jgi:hypothetical protein
MLNKLLDLCIQTDAIFEVQSKTVRVIKYKGEWIPNKRPELYAKCHVDDVAALGEIYAKLKNSSE